ncbi:MAG: UDP-N-acetylmuramoyl-L-alanyl-D-glutamate--2,6-diaminopimelate ligase [Planctomycetota bacterium]|nr:MAG: UDP-N-acetylmuramoyl-L-alanyl-D-glutamate--2,6-diaminopimelate ligase [Planctomycetota bacterium]
MNFDELLALLSSEAPPRICTDSRLVKAGDVFIAVKGTLQDGHNFINQAVQNSAQFIVCQSYEPSREPQTASCEIIIVGDSAKAAATLAQASRHDPAAKLTNLAVTGTNGKTTVAFLAQSIIQNTGQRCGLLGTIIYDTGLAASESNLTTPDCLDIAEAQYQMLKAGTKYMVIEASSHALEQNRLFGINFKAAAFTNLAGDHLDYHKTEEHYLAAKTRLFQDLSPDAAAVLNKQSPHAQQIARKTDAKILWYAVDEPADITAHIQSMDIDETVFILQYAGQKQAVNTPLIGPHNVSNHAAAAGLCLAVGFDLQTIAAGLSALKTIPGRLEEVQWDGNFSVLVDYAHTDDALRNVLSTLKPLCKANLIVVFGCGGDRDRTKRPRMAKVAEQLAGSVIVTSDNPRTEKPEDIISEIITGLKNPDSENIKVEPDRKKAIELALKTAAKDDIVLITGKGHETYQIIGTEKFDFSDSEIARQYLAKRI